MSEPLTITIPGTPQGKGRPRFSGKTRTAYTPAKTAAYEAVVGRMATLGMRGRDQFFGPIHITMRAHMPIPKSWSKAKRDQALLGELKPTSKPDLDNILKAIADGLQGIAYDDDSAIVSATVSKVYAAGEPFVVATIRPAYLGAVNRVPEIKSEPSQCQKQG